MKTLKNYLQNISESDALSLTISNTELVRGTYLVAKMNTEQWNNGNETRLVIYDLVAMDGGDLTAADVWIKDGRIKKVVTRAFSKDGRQINHVLHTKDHLRGVNLRSKDWLFSAADAVEISLMFSKVYSDESS